MKNSLPHTLFDTARARISARLESDDATPLEWWMAMPRVQLAHAVSDFGQRIMRLGNRIDDSASDGDEIAAWNQGLEIGRRMGRPEPSRAAIETLLMRLGCDTSDATMAKLGHQPVAGDGAPVAP